MPSFSISAPQLTDEEQQRERDALSDQERTEIEQDVLGTARFMETPEMTTQGLAQFQHELSLIPDEEKEAYLEAVRRVPCIVESETNPIKFLRATHFDAKKAARRMVTNWEMRKATFGQKAFSPMTVDGALSEDSEVLATGFFQCLQDGGADKRGVIVFDRPRLVQAIFDRESGHRVMWYVLHVVSEHAFSQRNGIIIIVDAQKYLLEHFDRKLSRRLWEFAEDGTPFQLSAVHFCTGGSRTTYNIILPVVRVLMGRRNRLRTIVHTGPAHVDSLSTYGLEPNCIPSALGGNKTLENHHAWIQQRRLEEGRTRKRSASSAQLEQHDEG